MTNETTRNEADERMRALKADRILCTGGRTGRKIHLAFGGSSCTECGHWMKANAVHFKVGAYTSRMVDHYRKHLCERCFPAGADPAIEHLRKEEAAG